MNVDKLIERSSLECHALNQIIDVLSGARRNKNGIRIDAPKIEQRFGIYEVNLIEHHKRTRLARANLFQNAMDRIKLTGKVIIRCIGNHEDQIGLTNLRQGRFKGINEPVRKLLDETDGIGDRHRPAARQAISTRCRIKRSEELILRKYRRPSQSVKKRRFTSVGIARKSDAERGRSDPLLRLHGPSTLNHGKLASNRSNAVANHASIDFELAFSLSKTASNATARLLLRKVAPHATKARQKILKLCKLHLEPPLTRLSVQPENIKNQSGSIDDLHRLSNRFLKIRLLRRGKVIIKDNNIGVEARDEPANLGHFARSDKRPRIRSFEPLRNTSNTLSSSGIGKTFELIE